MQSLWNILYELLTIHDSYHFIGLQSSHYPVNKYWEGDLGTNIKIWHIISSILSTSSITHSQDKKAIEMSIKHCFHVSQGT